MFRLWGSTVLVLWCCSRVTVLHPTLTFFFWNHFVECGLFLGKWFVHLYLQAAGFCDHKLLRYGVWLDNWLLLSVSWYIMPVPYCSSWTLYYLGFVYFFFSRLLPLIRMSINRILILVLWEFDWLPSLTVRDLPFRSPFFIHWDIIAFEALGLVSFSFNRSAIRRREQSAHSFYQCSYTLIFFPSFFLVIIASYYVIYLAKVLFVFPHFYCSSFLCHISFSPFNGGDFRLEGVTLLGLAKFSGCICGINQLKEKPWKLEGVAIRTVASHWGRHFHSFFRAF